MNKSRDGKIYALTDLVATGEWLNAAITGTESGRLSLGGVFSELHSGRGGFPAAKIPDGRHTLFLHLPGETLPLCEVEKCGKGAKRIFTEADIKNAEVGYIELSEKLSALEKRLKRLEAEAFESVLF